MKKGDKLKTYLVSWRYVGFRTEKVRACNADLAIDRAMEKEWSDDEIYDIETTEVVSGEEE
jgi:hypothetical protein